MTSETDPLIASIDARLQQLAHEITLLEAARTALDGEAAAHRPARRRRRSNPAPTTEVVPQGKLSKLLAASDGLSTAQLAKQANAAQDQVLALLKEMEAAGQARRTGSRRATRWHVITDEEKIAARAAELEKARR